MRAFLILCVALVTLMTFYSALWYKSEDIQTDITARVTQDLDTANANAVDIDVDGRHVTLTGVVYDEATETEYLDVANNTYGALGPIDGLTYLAGGGFVKAVKSADGITLSGSVPSQAARETLVAEATKSTDGTVTDNLSIGGSDGAWEAEAGYGLAKMADLSNGALAVSPGSYTLSGLATGDGAGATALKDDLAAREGWQTFVSSPAVEEGLTKDVARLTDEVSTRDQTINSLTGERDALTGERDALNQSVDGTSAERDTLAASLAAMTLNRDTATTARDTAMGERDAALGEVNTANTVIAERDTTIAALTTQVEDLNTKNRDLSAEFDKQQAALNGDQKQVVELQNKIDVQSITIADLTADLDAGKGQLSAAQDQVTQRDADVARLDGEIADLQSQLEGQTTGDADAAARIAALSANVDDQTAKADALSKEAETLGKQVTDLTAVVATRDATIVSLQNAQTTTPAVPVASNTGTAEQCAARANEILETTQINFDTGTARIERASVATLERLTGIALACSDSGLSMEIGGHTDSQGSDADNQALSERRANAIATFMAERSVPADTLKAVGFGEANPIADNTTSAGRAQNRRISFEWQAR